MQDGTGTFERLRPRLMAIGYRMLASVHEAEDLVQDAWLRWHEDEGGMRQDVRNAEAWLVTMTTRMAIDRLRAAKVRQIVSRAKARLRRDEPSPTVGPDVQFEVLRGFADALSRGDFAGLQALLAEHSQLLSDGGGIVPSFGKALLGARRIAQLYWAAHRNHGERMRVELARLNGQWTLLRFIDGRLESVQSFETDGERIVRIHVQRNPIKLERLSSRIRARAVTNRNAEPS